MPSKDFLALNPGFAAADMPGANRRRTKRHAPELARPERAKPGEGDRVPDLMKLAALGWTRTNYDHKTGEHYLTRQDGTTGPRVSSYRAMIEEGLRLMQQVTDLHTRTMPELRRRADNGT